MKNVFQWFKTLISNYIRHDNSRYSASIAFYTLFSLAPMLMVGITVASWKYSSQEAQEELFVYVKKTLGNESEQALRTISKHIGFHELQWNQSDIWASVLSIVILLIGASKVITELHYALNNIFDLEDDTLSKKLLTRIRARVVSISLVILLGLLLAVSMFLDTLMLSLGKLVENKLGYTVDFLSIAEKLISFLCIPFLIALYMKILPSRPIPLKNLWFGTAVSTLLFYLGKYLMSLYISYTGMTSAYGAAGSLVILLVWIYFSIEVLLIGAEICALSLAKPKKILSFS